MRNRFTDPDEYAAEKRSVRRLCEMLSDACWMARRDYYRNAIAIIGAASSELDLIRYRRFAGGVLVEAVRRAIVVSHRDRYPERYVGAWPVSP